MLCPSVINKLEQADGFTGWLHALVFRYPPSFLSFLDLLCLSLNWNTVLALQKHNASQNCLATLAQRTDASRYVLVKVPRPKAWAGSQCSITIIKKKKNNNSAAVYLFFRVLSVLHFITLFYIISH